MHVHIICNIYIFIGLNATTIEEQGDISLQGIVALRPELSTKWQPDIKLSHNPREQKYEQHLCT